MTRTVYFVPTASFANFKVLPPLPINKALPLIPPCVIIKTPVYSKYHRIKLNLMKPLPKIPRQLNITHLPTIVEVKEYSDETHYSSSNCATVSFIKLRHELARSFVRHLKVSPLCIIGSRVPCKLSFTYLISSASYLPG